MRSESGSEVATGAWDFSSCLEVIAVAVSVCLTGTDAGTDTVSVLELVVLFPEPSEMIVWFVGIQSLG